MSVTPDPDTVKPVVDGMKALVLGFSVVGDKDGFVEKARLMRGPSDSFDLRKIGFGGSQIDKIKYLIPEVSARFPSDLIILEIATGQHRFSDGNGPKWYEHQLDQIITHYLRIGISVAIMDLPRRDITMDADPIYSAHKNLSLRRGIPYLRIPLNEAFLRDDVHTNEPGTNFYARELLRFVRSVEADWQSGNPVATPASAPFHDAVRLSSLGHPDIEFNSFCRAGYEVEVALLRPQSQLEIDLGGECTVVGLSCIVGPTSGKIAVSSPTKEITFQVYNRNAYYSFFSLFTFEGLQGPVTLRQLPDLPEIELLKGLANKGPREGKIGHLLIERRTARPFPGKKDRP